MQLVKVEAFHPEKMPEEILDLFISTLTEQLPLPRSPIEILIVERIERQLRHCQHLTPHVYRNAELMGLIITHNHFCLIDLAAKNPGLQRLNILITRIYENLPNKDSVDHFLANSDYEYGQDPTLATLLSIECRTLMSQLLDSECRTQQTDLPLEHVIHLMIQGKLPFLATCLKSSLRLDTHRFDPIRNKVFEVIGTGIQARSSVIKKVASLIEPPQLDTDMALAIDYISKNNTEFYSKPSYERAFIALHLVLLKGLLESPLASSNTMRDDKRIFLNLFKHFYQFFSDHQLTDMLTQEYFRQATWGRLLKFKFASLFEMQVLVTRKEFCHYITDRNFLHAISHITTLDRFLKGILNDYREQNVLKDFLCNTLIYKLFSVRIGEFRNSDNQDALGWLHSRCSVTRLLMEGYQHKLPINGEELVECESLNKLLTCYSLNDIKFARSKIPDILFHFKNILGLINDIAGICDCDNSSESSKKEGLENLTRILGNETVSNLSRIITYWFGQWDNDQPLDFYQVRLIVERLIYSVITNSVNDRILNDEIIRILGSTCTLTQKDTVEKEQPGCYIM